MSLRLRMIIAAATAVAVAVVLVALGAYVTTRHELRHQLDVSLSRRVSGPLPIPRRAVDILGTRPVDNPVDRIGAGFGGVFQLIASDGRVVVPSSGVVLPVNAQDRAVAAGTIARHWQDVRVGETHWRVLTAPAPLRLFSSTTASSTFAVQAALPLDTVDATLSRLVFLLAILSLGGIALATGLGWLVARAALSPVDRLTAAAERVAATQDLKATIPVHGADEIARLGRAINAMLVALDDSQRSQRRLVADASHELRTPLTSLRTNLEVLARTDAMSEADRQAILGDLVAQVAELGSLVGQLVDLDRDEVTTKAPVELDAVVEAAMRRARLNAPGLTFSASLEPTVVEGNAGTLERAVANLLDNAAKWSPAGATVEVTLRGGVVRVRDHGPGIDPVDAPHVFERFYRSPSARALPGSGLGLSIVAKAAEEHDGHAGVEPADGGGTVAYLQLPLSRPPLGHFTPPSLPSPPPVSDPRSPSDATTVVRQ